MLSFRLFVLAAFIPLACTLAAQITIADAGPDQELCSSNAFLDGNAVASGEVGVWTLVSGLLTINDPNDPESEVTYAAPGVNVLQWTITDGTSTTTDQVVIWVYDGNAPTASAGVDVSIQLPLTSTWLQAGPFSYPTTCMWTIVMGSGVIIEPDQAITMASGLTVGSNLFQWTCDNGPCGSTFDVVAITVEEAMAVQHVAQMIGPQCWFDAASERVRIEADEVVQRVVLIDQTGRIVRDRSMNARAGSFDVSDLSIGTYLVRLMGEDTLFTARVALVRW